MLLARRISAEVMIDSEDGDEHNILGTPTGGLTQIESARVEISRGSACVDILLPSRLPKNLLHTAPLT